MVGKLKKHLIYILVVLYLLIYFCISIYSSTFWGDLLSPAGAFLAASIFTYIAYKTERMRYPWRFLSLAGFSWAISDVIWAILELGMDKNPDNMIIFSFLYLIPNIMILLACIVYAFQAFKSLNRIQLLLDMVTVSASCFVLFWVLMMHGSIHALLHNFGSWILSIYSASDFIVLVGIFIGTVSFRKERPTHALYLMAFGILLYCAVDLVYCYTNFYNAYVPNSLTDFVYILAFLIAALGGLLTLKENTEEWFTKFYAQNNNLVRTKISLIFLFPPAILILSHHFNYIPIAILVIIFLFYSISSGYVQNSERTHELLLREKNINEFLESQIVLRTSELTTANCHLEYQSRHDDVTKVFNTLHFKEAVDEILQDERNEVAIVFMVLDRFKVITDTYGHDIGDAILFEIAQRVQSTLGDGDIFARIGGDEFAIAIQGYEDHSTLEQKLYNILRQSDSTITIQNYSIKVTMCLGTAIYPEDGNSRSLLMRYADIAVNQAKQNSIGLSRSAFFSKTMGQAIQQRHEIEMLMLNADFEKELRVLYQPQINIQNNKVTGFEALVRWQSPSGGFIVPDKFIAIAEETGCIEKIGDWVMHEAAKQIAIWNKKYGYHLKMGINISPKQLENISFMDKITELIETYGLDTSWLDFEITENIAMKGEITMEEIFQSLAALNITTSIDDFGTGYSSLSYIHQFSFDKIKIAKQLVDSITTDVGKCRIIEAIISIANVMNIGTIAEGVETLEQLNLLQELGCDEIQGYYISRPIPAEDIEKTFLE